MPVQHTLCGMRVALTWMRRLMASISMCSWKDSIPTRLPAECMVTKPNNNRFQTDTCSFADDPVALALRMSALIADGVGQLDVDVEAFVRHAATIPRAPVGTASQTCAVGGTASGRYKCWRTHDICRS